MDAAEPHNLSPVEQRLTNPATLLDELNQARADILRLKALAYTDMLTGLPNRRRLEEELDRQLQVAGRHGRSLSLIAFDLDRFKTINDRYGHGTGDEVLKLTAQCVGPLLRAGDSFGRWGGEEFLVIAPETTLVQAHALAERIRKQIEATPYPHDLKATASFGVATNRQGMTAKGLLAEVDAWLYQAKRGGRNRVTCTEV